MKKYLFAILCVTVLSGCATTGTETQTVVRADPRIIYVHPHDPWKHHHHWHWTWAHRHGWGWHHPRHHHFQPQPLPNRNINEPRRSIPRPVGPERGEQLR